MKVQRCNFIPENEIGIIKDLDTLIHNLVTPELKELQQENKQLKVELQEANDNIIWWQNRFNAVERDNRELQQKIDKAIEYIKENCSNYYVEKPNYRGVELINIEELLEILGDKENE